MTSVFALVTRLVTLGASTVVAPVGACWSGSIGSAGELNWRVFARLS